MNIVSGPTDLQLIESYISRRDHIKKLNDAFEDSIKPFKAQMQTLENEMLRRLNERGAEHTNTDAGTAYKETVIRVKCTDKEAYHRYAIEHYEAFGKDLLTAHVSNEGLRFALEVTKNPSQPDGCIPPGLNISSEIVVRFRKA